MNQRTPDSSGKPDARIPRRRTGRDGTPTPRHKCASPLPTIAQRAFPGLRGFSASNVSRMRAFYRAYARETAFSAQAVPKVGRKKSAQAVPKVTKANVAQAVRQITDDQPPVLLSEIPWGHNVILLFKGQAFRPRPTTLIRRENARTWLEPSGPHAADRERSVHTPGQGDQHFRGNSALAGDAFST